MTIKERLEQQERAVLGPRAMLSCQSRGREKPISADEMRTEFQRDRDRILHCKSFRRLKGKTQVFIAPQGDHYRTRLTHTLSLWRRRSRWGTIWDIRRSAIQAKRH